MKIPKISEYHFLKNQIGEVFLVPLDLLCTSPPGLALVAARGCGLMLEPQPVSPSHLGHSHAALPGLSTPAPSVGVVSGGPFLVPVQSLNDAPVVA